MKKFRFLFFTLLLGFLFFPKDTFALEVDNVKFYNNNQLVHTFTKQDLQGGYASVDPVLVDAFHINYVDANLKTNYVYDFEANFNMAGNRLFNDVVDFFVYASPEGSTSNLLTSTDSWFLYSAEQVSPYYNGEYVVNSSFTSTVNSNNLRFQYDLGDELILSSFRLNSAKLTNDGQDVGDVISNQTQELLENQNKNQQETNERLDELKKQLSTCRDSKNLIKSFYTTGYLNAYASQLYIGFDLQPNTTYTLSYDGTPGAMFYTNEFVSTSKYFTNSSNRTYITFTTISNPTTYPNGWLILKNAQAFSTAPTFDNLMLVKGSSHSDEYEPPGEICKSKIDETNEKLEEAEETRKGIWETIKDLPNMFKNMFLSLFVPDENYFEDKFDELLGNVEDVLGFLAYPFTLITRTFEFFLTIEDTGNYVISWEDVKVPNFEEYSIIEAGSFDFATLLEDSRVASLRNIAFVFINALLLLAFLQLCHNKYNEVFGGDVSTTEFISVAEEYDIDYKTGEVSNIKHIEKKTTRRDIK